MGSAFGCITRTDLENASATDVGLCVGKFGPDYKKYQIQIVSNAFNGVYITFSICVLYAQIDDIYILYKI
jgi:hypothetical protein